MATRANGGDIVILKSSGDSAYYNDQISSQTPTPSSVTTLVIDTSNDANNADYATAVQNAEAIFIAGGDQGRYISQWKGNLVGDALVGKAGTCLNANACAMAGSSAGMHVLGAMDYTGVRGSAESRVVLPNPRDATISEFMETPLPIGQDWAPLGVFDGTFLTAQSGIMDTHFEARDRMGRWMVMMAKKNTAGVAVGERSAYIQEPGAAARILEGSANGVFLSATVQNAQWQVDGFSGMTQLNKLTTTVPPQTYQVTATRGVLASTAEAGLIYGVR